MIEKTKIINEQALPRGNFLLHVISNLWLKVPLWARWLILVGCALFSAAFIFSVMKRLERSTKS